MKINHKEIKQSQLGKTVMLTKKTSVFKTCSAALLATLVSWGVNASQLQGIDYQVLPGDKVQLRLQYSDAPPTPQEFTTDNPARISMDFAGVDSGLDFKTKNIGIGVVSSVTALEVQDRTRVVINLAELVSYHSEAQGNDFIVTLGAGSQAAVASPATTASASSSSTSGYDIAGIDFRRNAEGAGRVLVDLGNPNVSVDVRQEGRNVIADFVGSDINPEFLRRLDVVDFGTPAQIIETSRRGNNVRMVIRGTNSFEYLAYQADTQYAIELKPLTQKQIEQRERNKPKYVGDRLTLKFQNMDLRGILHTLGEFAGLNIVISDDVQGTMALNLVQVPWDQAMDIILKSKGLGQRREGNVVMIAPAEAIAANEKKELEAMKQVEELSPLRTELIQVNYAKALELASLLKPSTLSTESSTATQTVGILSDRGAVSVDERTNSLLVRDTAEKIEDARNLVTQLDIPVRQVLIEARVVTADDGFVAELGSSFTLSKSGANNTMLHDGALNVNLPPSTAAGTLGLSFERLANGLLLDMELSALESENRGEVVASPKVITSNQKEAYIKAGEEIPYLQGGSSGASNIQFKEAVLELKVVPQITPDGRVNLSLTVKQDTRGEDVVFTTANGEAVGGAPAINTQEVSTEVLVDNGETIVLGGIFQHRTKYDESKVPLLGDIPLLGWLFKSTSREDAKSELLIFVTPKILEPGLKN